MRKFEEELEADYNHFANIAQIAFVGGTGAAYYEPFIEVLEEKHLDIAKENTVLMDVELGKTKLEPVYTIAVGLAKNIASVTGCIK